MESTSYAIFLCTRHNVAGNFFYKRDIVPGKSAQDNVLPYRPRLRSKKWWWNLFSNALKLAVVAACRLHRELHQDSSTALSHLDFRRDVTTHLLRAKPRLTIRTGRRAYPPETLRITEGHYLEPISQGRCRVCKKNCRLHCVECRERLHRKCFPLYHRVST
ncbi:PiggyBac transposable element-derived protein 2 [Trichinella patagoniensis]|uniref:PiggyBac transposable element-derived protein 2 n=1 Tax=Trichinella patagoniensis TaxID=990121 RepID=A0A0V0ZZA5_9BILA|nr:PiggyBac transposable element-derived protein 2 [Trichinella patagoniensis]